MSPLLADLRYSRKRPVVLKTQILGVRSREKLKPIFVFEGIEDVGPYSVWAARCDGSITFEPLIANGKDQILFFRDSIRPHETYLRTHVYFFLDRDFDDMKGFATGPDVFVTDMYSIENYLVSARVLESILVDELRCAGERIDTAIELFNSVIMHFLKVMSPANRRIFYARRLSIGSAGSGIENRVGKYVLTELESVRPLAGPEQLRILIPLESEPLADDVIRIDAEFENLDPLSRHRGKFILGFFMKWLDLLAAERVAGKKEIFTSAVRTGFSTQQLSKRSLATRSEIPRGLSAFLGEVKKRRTSPN